MNQISMIKGSRGVTFAAFEATTAATLEAWQRIVENARNLGYGDSRKYTRESLDSFVSAADADTEVRDWYPSSSVELRADWREFIEGAHPHRFLPQELRRDFEQVAVYRTCSGRAFFWAGDGAKPSSPALIGFATFNCEGSETAFNEYFLPFIR